MKTIGKASGKYILYPDGGAWQYVELRDGEVVCHSEEAMASTHAAARDDLAWLAEIDHEATSACDLDESIAVLVAFGDYRGHRANADAWVVCRV